MIEHSSYCTWTTLSIIEYQSILKNPLIPCNLHCPSTQRLWLRPFAASTSPWPNCSCLEVKQVRHAQTNLLNRDISDVVALWVPQFDFHFIFWVMRMAFIPPKWDWWYTDDHDDPRRKAGTASEGRSASPKGLARRRDTASRGTQPMSQKAWPGCYKLRETGKTWP